MSQSSQPVGDSRPSGRPLRRSKQAGPESYDFRRPAKLARDHVRTLQIAYETFARQFSTLLTTGLRAVSHVSLASIGQQSCEEYILSLPTSTVLAMCTIEPLPGITVLEFSLGIAMVSIDHLLGGTGGDQPQRPLTEIETPLLRGLITRVLGELRYALDPIVAVNPQLIGIEYNPQFAQIGVPSDIVVVASFDMKVGLEECVATVCMPFNSIFPTLQEEQGDLVLSDAERDSRELVRRNITAGVEQAPIDVSVSFQPVLMHPADLVDLEPGDVVPLAHPTSVPLAVTAAGMTFAHAMPGSRGTRLACLVVPSPSDHAPGKPFAAASGPAPAAPTSPVSPAKGSHP
ncbi:MAG: flagellar motor switch protein FliM [Dactylosporangium sp.]|nr:flagellar motor switch protein FliM [Dactylosporangium sp.]NNJ61285.1 flagellar motor switch protein FliM [Dactylosporangium sp.]